MDFIAAENRDQAEKFRHEWSSRADSPSYFSSSESESSEALENSFSASESDSDDEQERRTEAHAKISVKSVKNSKISNEQCAVTTASGEGTSSGAKQGEEKGEEAAAAAEEQNVSGEEREQEEGAQERAATPEAPAAPVRQGAGSNSSESSEGLDIPVIDQFIQLLQDCLESDAMPMNAMQNMTKSISGITENQNSDPGVVEAANEVQQFLDFLAIGKISSLNIQNPQDLSEMMAALRELDFFPSIVDHLKRDPKKTFQRLRELRDRQSSDESSRDSVEPPVKRRRDDDDLPPPPPPPPSGASLPV